MEGRLNIGAEAPRPLRAPHAGRELAGAASSAAAAFPKSVRLQYRAVCSLLCVRDGLEDLWDLIAHMRKEKIAGPAPPRNSSFFRTNASTIHLTRKIRR